eukprot:CAMPEP_0119367454 /NCGR_PEP_ID=MMETSP1334-20130426/14242_1 /TAXON_ID=127549 /ORGANISM="Calcidiscus leptoporus, Strain RCC1130" /LENGTH=57 /DNA_ID=CAMNT_0007383861 /DNA_START=264 /DNA_END=433 /DNA_ORIENTATION=-
MLVRVVQRHRAMPTPAMPDPQTSLVHRRARAPPAPLARVGVVVPDAAAVNGSQRVQR